MDERNWLFVNPKEFQSLLKFYLIVIPSSVNRAPGSDKLKNKFHVRRDPVRMRSFENNAAVEFALWDDKVIWRYSKTVIRWIRFIDKLNAIEHSFADTSRDQ